MPDIQHIGDLKPDQRNARRHTPRNIGMIVDALHEVGAARSIVIDEEGNILAGNGTVEAAAEAGIERVQVVEADGETIVAVRRTGLTPTQKKRLALYDNRTAELAEWDSEELTRLLLDDVPIENLWNENEFAILTGNLPEADDPRALWDGMPEMNNEPTACRMLTIYFKESQDVAAFAALLDQTVTDKTKSLWYPAQKQN